MGKVIAICLLIAFIAVIIAGIAVYMRRKQGQEKAQEKGWATKGDLNKDQEAALIKENDLAANLLRDLLTPPRSLDGDISLLSSDHKLAAELWLSNYSSLRLTRKAK